MSKMLINIFKKHPGNKVTFSNRAIFNCELKIMGSRPKKGKTNLDFTEARDSEWQWHQLGPYASLHVAADK